MARSKHYDYAQMKMLAVSFDRQILPGSFEHTLNRLIDEEFDWSVFEARYRNDETGAPAYDAAILLKVIVLAYARSVTSSRRIERLCQTRLRPVRAARPMPAAPATDPGAPSRNLPRAASRTTADLQRTHETQDRHRARPLRVRAAPGNGGTGVRQHRTCAWLEALQPARSSESQHAVDALLPGAQHRQAATLRRNRQTIGRRQRIEAPRAASGTA